MMPRPTAATHSTGRMYTPVLALLALAIGGLALMRPGTAHLASPIWFAGTLITGTPVVLQTLTGAVRGRFAADLVATLAILSALLLRQPLVGLVIVLMQGGGEALESLARRRATTALRELEAASPRRARRRRGNDWEEVRAEDLGIGDVILVRPGELVPCDGRVIDGRANVDVSTLTGEPVPVGAREGVWLMSGSQVLDGPISIRVAAKAGDSQYARIVELVRSARASKSELQRLADRYATWFTPLTLAVCVAAYVISGDALRVLAVLAVATPCPLILATPVAILGGIDRAARRQIIIRDGGALERLETVTVAVMDKTGTLTLGRPSVSKVMTMGVRLPDDLLRLAAAVETGSGHLLARVLVAEAESRGFVLPVATEVQESPGRGISGRVQGRSVLVGSRSLLRQQYPLSLANAPSVEGRDDVLRAYVAIDGDLAGVIEFADGPRPEAPEVVDGLRQLGVRRVSLLSGDRREVAERIGRAVGVDDVQGDLLAEDKVVVVRRFLDEGQRVLAVGDGVNDAPALREATVGVAMAGHGRGITAEAADVVVLADDLRRVTEALAISRRAMGIARQSIRVGLGLSAIGMVAAALGYLLPTAGALTQEAIDMAVILNALRARTAGRRVPGPSVDRQERSRGAVRNPQRLALARSADDIRGVN